MFRVIKSFLLPDIAGIVFEYAETVILAYVRETDEQFDVCYYCPNRRQWFKDASYPIPAKTRLYRKYIYLVDLIQGQPIECQNV